MSDKHKRELRGVFFVFIVTFILILGCFLFFGYRARVNASKPFSMELVNGGDGKMEGITVFFETSQEWESVDADGNPVVGAQYDGVIFNDYTYDIQNWELVIDLPADGWIDSSWNGVYQEEAGKIIVTPLDYNTAVYAQDNLTFGFVLYADSVLELENFELKGYCDVKFRGSSIFQLLVTVSCIWLICLLVYVTVILRIRRLQVKRENDSQIISQALTAFARLVDAKDPYTKGHSLRVSAYTRELARRMHMDKEEIESLGYIALMHDCGKMGIPDEVLNKPSALTPEERKIIESHTLLGGDVLENFTAIEGVREGALYHHERYDGHGYPKGLRKEDIPLCARIICVADSYDAMNSDRCYRKHLSEEVILQELDRNAGKQFDPEIVCHMIDMIRDGFVKEVKNEE